MAPLGGRNSFLQVVAGELQGREFGDGDVHRAIVTGRNASSLIRPLSRRVDGIADSPLRIPRGSARRIRNPRNSPRPIRRDTVGAARGKPRSRFAAGEGSKGGPDEKGHWQASHGMDTIGTLPSIASAVVLIIQAISPH